MSIEQAYEILERSIIYSRCEPVGTAAACDPKPVAANYEECFVRDFVSAALVFLLNGRPESVRNFLDTVMQLREVVRVKYWIARRRLNFRFFSQGNLLAVLFGVAWPTTTGRNPTMASAAI